MGEKISALFDAISGGTESIQNDLDYLDALSAAVQLNITEGRDYVAMRPDLAHERLLSFIDQHLDAAHVLLSLHREIAERAEKRARAVSDAEVQLRHALATAIGIVMPEEVEALKARGGEPPAEAA